MTSTPDNFVITGVDPTDAATFEDGFAKAVAHFGLEESEADDFRNTWGWMSHSDRAWTLEDAVGMVALGRTFGQGRKAGNTPAVPTSGKVPPPDTLSKEGTALYESVERRSTSDKVDWFTAFAKVTKSHDYKPPRLVAGPMSGAASPESEEEDRLAQEIMRSHAIAYIDAASLVRHTKEVAEAKKEKPSDVPWLDTRPLSIPPRPWSDEDWERDMRRAAAGGVSLERVEWEVAAEQGQDLVPERAGKARADHIAQLEGRSESMVRRAQEAEAKLRAEAIEGELDRRAKQRLKTRGLTGPTNAVFR